MKKLPLLITIPLIVVLLVVVAAMSIRMFGTQSTTSVKTGATFPNSVTNTDVGQPSTFLGGMFGKTNATPTPTPATAADLSRELKDTYDDGGQAELDELTRDAASL